MPVPIMPVNTDSLMRRERDYQIQPTEYCQINVADLPTSFEKKSKFSDLLKVSNNEANLLFRLWSESGAGPNDSNIVVPSSVDNNDLLRLKACGLIVGDTSSFTMTQRGRDVILTLALGEKNAFDKSSSSNTFEKILSDRQKLASGGPRLALGKGK
jgi:hypothetical protein